LFCSKSKILSSSWTGFFFLGGKTPTLHKFPNELDRNIIFEIEAKIDRSECEGRQNARLRVRFDSHPDENRDFSFSSKPVIGQGLEK